MAKEEYGVDLDALDQVMKELNQVLKDMGGPKDKAKNSTYLPNGALGNNFDEQKELQAAHESMKTFIEKNILGLIEGLVDDFGKKTKKVKEAYDDAEAKNSMK
ncbi:hypothetical protein [Streptomyces sp. NPDC048639]|uniref:hypothetical protein n=1 Tax=Streptomyces sp. NPDC048639 TaxID=3365581 RepID=UPI003710D097